MSACSVFDRGVSQGGSWCSSGHWSAPDERPCARQDSHELHFVRDRVGRDASPAAALEVVAEAAALAHWATWPPL